MHIQNNVIERVKWVPHITTAAARHYNVPPIAVFSCRTYCIIIERIFSLQTWHFRNCFQSNTYTNRICEYTAVSAPKSSKLVSHACRTGSVNNIYIYHTNIVWVLYRYIYFLGKAILYYRLYFTISSKPISRFSFICAINNA